MTAPGETPPPATLGKYQLIRRLATGGMAELYLSRAQGVHGFEKVVVLKRILPQHAESEDFIRMFLTEARLAATLHHPNIVQVYDIGEDQNQHFFTMEYVQGQDLRKLVRAARKQQKPIPLEHILHIIMGVAAGLHHAHDKVGMDGKPLNIVHRDVSPSNVLVTYEGDIKIVDFGIAKAATAQVATIAGTLKGKIPYMSPEQCRGEGVDRRSDIFSIGTLLWELTTGKRLFAGDNEFAILNRVAKGDVPLPSSIRPDYPPELEAIVMRALQPEPDQRYATAQDLQIDLEDFAREARLPVSSARMSKFMGELFTDEIRATAEELGREQMPGGMLPMGADPQGYAPATPVAGTAMATAGGTRMATAPSIEADHHEYTPSELRHHGAATGPGGAYGSDTTNSGAADVPLDEVPGKMRTGPLIAVAVGFAAAIAVAGGVVWSMQQKADPDSVESAAGAEVQVIRSETPTDEEESPQPEDEEVKAPYVLDPAKPDPSLAPKLQLDEPPEDPVEPGTPPPEEPTPPEKTTKPEPKKSTPPATKTSKPGKKKSSGAKKPPPPPPPIPSKTTPKRPKKPKEEKKKGVNDLPF